MSKGENRRQGVLLEFYVQPQRQGHAQVETQSFPAGDGLSPWGMLLEKLFFR
jgi:hypothetical protein